jgi:hypothetical protein
LTGTQQFQTGTPFTIGNGDDFYGIGESNFKPWNLNGTTTQPKQFAAQNTDPSFWFTPTVNGSAWATRPTNGSYGNQNRNSISFHQPGFQNWNLSLLKNFAIRESQGVEFRFDAFNWVNHPNLSGADTNPTAGNFGKITGKNSQRELQLSLRYRF